ncbi:unnamed protein product, partial [Dicrocoelium dendriticum]
MSNQQENTIAEVSDDMKNEPIKAPAVQVAKVIADLQQYDDVASKKSEEVAFDQHTVGGNPNIPNAVEPLRSSEAHNVSFELEPSRLTILSTIGQ